MLQTYKSDINRKFNGKYCISSTRLKNYDYAQNGAYFVTICTKDRKHFFGKILELPIVETRFIASLLWQKQEEWQRYRMKYSELGNIAQKYCVEIPNYFPFVILGEWVVMPNHVHGIIIIDKIGNNKYRETISKDAINRVSTDGGITQNKNPMLHKNLSTIIRWYKGRTTFELRKINSNFSWQSRFYDHVIRNNDELSRASEYIISNPQNWEKDDYF